MKKVCHMTSAHRRYDVRVFEKECTSLAKAGYDVYLVVNDDLPDEDKNGVHIVSTGFVPSGRKERMTRGAKLVYKKAKAISAEIYHFHDPELMPYALKLKKAGKKVIFDSHEIYYQQIKTKMWIPSEYREAVSKLYYKYETKVCKRIDAVCTPGSVGVDVFGKRTEKVVVVGNMAALIDERNVNIKANIEQKKICTTGSLTEDRGITELIKACYRTDSHLILAGTFTPDSYFNELKDMTEYSCVDFRGLLRLDGVYDVIRESGIGICNIHKVGQYATMQNLPNKIYEYLSFGLPVIISDTEYFTDFVNTYKCGLVVEPDNADSITDAINYLYDHPDEAVQMGNNGKRIVEEKFNWSVDEKNLLDLYETL